MKQKLYQKSKSDVFNQCLRAIHELDSTVTYEDFTSGVIEASLKGNLLAFGHYLEFKVKEKRGFVELEINSETKGVQIIDWGTNEENELSFLT